MSSFETFFLSFFCPPSLPWSCLKVVAYLVWSCDFFPLKCVFVITISFFLKFAIATKTEGRGGGGEGGPAPEGAVWSWSGFEVWKTPAEDPLAARLLTLGSWLEMCCFFFLFSLRDLKELVFFFFFLTNTKKGPWQIFYFILFFWREKTDVFYASDS